ncbi:MAG: TIGR02391 family protein [Bryobacterales bacterium]|nr:TIGR02391 family protein [Bryobacterales bacterium]
MTLQTSLEDRLWAAIEAPYSAGNYTGAILDSIHFLSELIRSKSGLESDGHQLVGDAFGGPNPIVKVSPLQTDSDRNEQKGIEFLVRGLYTGVRNPRSHEKRVDTAETANAIIGLVDHLVRVIDKGRSPYDVPVLIQRVFDKHFAPTEKYAELLVREVPERRRFDVLMQVLQRRLEGDGKCVALFCKAMVKTLGPEAQASFWAAVSEALRTAVNDGEYRSAIQIAEGESWVLCSDLARLRAENRLIESIRAGRWNGETKRYKDGVLGTWYWRIAGHLQLRDELAAVLIAKLCSDEAEERAYVLHLFMPVLRELRPNPPAHLVHALVCLLKEHDEDVHRALSFLEDPWAEQEWVDVLLEAYKSFEPPFKGITDDDVPF